jgi:hypothetical protein
MEGVFLRGESRAPASISSPGFNHTPIPHGWMNGLAAIDALR